MGRGLREAYGSANWDCGPGIIQGYASDARLKALQDCVLFLQAQKLGFTALTANLVDFDYLLQLVPTGRALFYRVSK